MRLDLTTYKLCLALRQAQRPNPPVLYGCILGSAT